MVGFANQRNAHPQPRTPVFVPQLQCKELDEEANSRRIAPSQKEVFACQVFAVHDLATHPSDNIQLICSSHTVLGLHFKQYNANIVFIF